MDKKLLILLSFMAALGSATPAHAKNGYIVFCIDVSDSMNAGNKMYEAKQALKDSIKLLPASIQVGVLKFATHVTWVYETAPIDQTTLLTAIDDLYTEGATALGNAIDTASNELNRLQQYHGNAAANMTFQIVVLSDGANTTGPEPRGIVPVVRSRNQRLDVIGIDMGPEHELAKSADSYHSARNVQELFSAIKEVLQIENVTTIADDGVSDYDRIAPVPADVLKACLTAVIESTKASADGSQPSVHPSQPSEQGTQPQRTRPNKGRSVQPSNRRSGCEMTLGTAPPIPAMLLLTAIGLLVLMRRRHRRRRHMVYIPTRRPRLY